MTRFRRLEQALCPLLLALTAAAVLTPAFLARQVPFDGSRLLFYPPWEEACPPGFEPSTDPGALALIQRYFPWHAFMHMSGPSPRNLLWNPLEGCGVPFFAVWRTRCLSPFSAPFYALPPSEALPWSMLLKLLVAGWSAYYVARKLGLPPALGLAAGVGFQLSGPLLLWLGWPLSDVMPWLPLLFISVERLAIGQRRFWVTGACVVALMGAGGEPEALAGALLFMLFYLGFRTLLPACDVRAAISAAPLYLLAVAAGLCLLAVQIAPYVELSVLATSTARNAPGATLRLKDLILCFLPNYFGTSPGVFTDEGLARSTQVLRLLHVGVAQLGMLALWFSLRSFVGAWQRSRTEALLLAALVMTAGAMMAGRALAAVPLLRHLGPEHFLVGNALAFVLMAVTAADEWVALNAEECKHTLARLMIFAPLLACVGAACWLANRHTVWVETDPVPLQSWVLVGTVAALVALLAVTLLRPSLRTMGYGLAGLTFVALFAAHAPGMPRYDRALLFPETECIRALQNSPGRIGGSATLASWPVGGNLIPQVYSPSGVVLKRHAAFFAQMNAYPALLRRTGASELLLTKDDIQGPFAAMRPDLSIRNVFPGGAVLFRDLAAEPRARVVYEVRTVDRLDGVELQPGLPPMAEGAALAAGPSGPGAKAAVRPARTNARVTVDVETGRPSVLVLADTYYPGWRAYVDDERAPVFPVDGLFRGVLLKEGQHHVEFVYAPLSIKAGLWVSVLTALALLFELRHIVGRALRRD